MEVGQRFNRLVVVARLPRRRTSRKTYEMVECLCDCGTRKVFFAGNVREGKSTSCGCHRASRLARSGVRSSSPEMAAWRAMRSRCTDPNNRRYAGWGGRGIRVCDEWLTSFDTFLRDVGPRPSPRHSIDRIDNDGHYEPGNVRWATAKEQANNRRRPRQTVPAVYPTLTNQPEQPEHADP